MLLVQQLNLNKSLLANDNLRQMLINEKNPCIFCLQEPYYNKHGSLVGIPKNYNVFGLPRSRACIIASKDVDLIFSNEFSTNDITVCFMNSSKRYFASLYLDIHKDPIHPLMIKMAEYFNTTKTKALWCMDSNAHSSAFWNSSETNKRGEVLELFIMTHCAHVLNEGNVATFSSSRFNSIIDVTLAFVEHEDIVNWKVDTECFTFSDHKLITMKLGAKPPKKLWPKTDWAKFAETIKFPHVSYPYWNKNTIETESKEIEKIIKDKIKECTTMRKVKTFKDTWWNLELEKEKSQVQKLFHLRMRYPTADNIDKYKSAKKSFNRNIRRAKRSSWVQFCDSIKSPKQISKLDKIIRNGKPQNIGLLEKPDGGFARSVKETIDILMNTHLPGSKNCQDNGFDNLGNLGMGNPSTQTRSDLMDENSNLGKTLYDLNFDSFINETKVKRALNSLSPLKAAGRDGIKAKALQLIGMDGIKRITNLFKCIIEIGYIPQNWLVYDLIFLPKPGKDNYKQAKSFRGISLIQTLFKGLERLILWELEETTLKENPVSKRQFGFKKGASTEHALSSLVDEIESAILRGKIALCTFCDIEQAFDNIKFSSCIKSLEEKNFPPKIIKWYKYYLENRYAETSLHGEKVRKKVQKGVQQGSLLSPLIWSVYFDKWLSLPLGAVISKAFCDDGMMLVTGHCQDTLVDIMQQAINKTMRFGIQEDLKFNPRKTNVMFFHRKNKFKEPKKLTMSGVEIPYSDSVKYLGLTLDTRLRFNVHIDNKVMKAKKHLILLRNAISSTFGPSPGALWWGYNGIILQSFLYGANVFARACKTKTAKEKFTKLNRLIACCMAPFRRSTPNHGLEVILNLPPLDLKVEERALKTMLRVIPQVTPKWDGQGKNEISTLTWARNLLKKMEIDPYFDDSCQPTLNISRNFEVNLDSFKSGLPISNSTTNCYSDGSKHTTTGRTGYGLVVTRGDYIIGSENAQLSNKNSVFQAEIYAIDKSCQLLKEMEVKNATIFSDSMSGLQALDGTLTKTKTVKNCIDSLNALGKSCKIELSWVAGHQNHTGNEAADALAKIGTTNESNKVNLPPPKTIAKNKIRDAMHKQWNERWISSNECRQSKIFFPQIDIKKSTSIINLDRKNLGMMVQVITGHNRLYYHQSLMEPMQQDSSCRFCQEEEETAYHLVCTCPRFWRSRMECFNDTFLEETPEWKVKQLLKFLKKMKMTELLNPGIQQDQ